MIAICAGLMRTGSVAMWQVMRELVVSKNAGYAPALGTEWEGNYERWLKEDGIVITKLHRPNDILTKGLVEENDIRAVMTVRDYRDVVVSLINFREDTFEGVVSSRVFSGNIDAYYEWLKLFESGSIMKVRYEDFIGDRADTVKCVAKFLGLSVTDEEAKRVDREWNIDANRKRAAMNLSIHSPEYMSGRHIRSGESRQWQSELTDEQVAHIEDKAGEWLTENGYELWTSQ